MRHFLSDMTVTALDLSFDRLLMIVMTVTQVYGPLSVENNNKSKYPIYHIEVSYISYHKAKST